MANRDWNTPRKRDKDLLESFKRIQAALSHDSPTVLHLTIAERSPQQSIQMIEVEKNPIAKALLDLNTAMALRTVFELGALQSSVAVVRPADHAADRVSLSFPDHMDGQMLLRLLAAVSAEFPQYVSAEAVEKLLGTELAEFYRARETALLRLESVAQKIIEDTDRYRQKLDERLDTERTRLASEAEELRSGQLEEHDARMKGLDGREEELNQRSKELDDRDSRHARRALRQDLQRVLGERAKQFALTSGTANKRRPVHILFWAILAAAAAVIATTILERWGSPYDVTSSVRLILGFAGFVGTLFVYIRWADQWFRQHADEEFRLKRMSLDVDRASWVVETAMEWQAQNKAAIPTELLDQLARGLFVPAGSGTPVRHPAEDLASAVVGASSSLRVNLPGVGEATFSRRGVRRLQEAMDASVSSQ